MQDLDSTKIEKITVETAVNLVSLCNNDDPKFNGVAHELILHLTKNSSTNWKMISDELNSISEKAMQGLSQKMNDVTSRFEKCLTISPQHSLTNSVSPKRDVEMKSPIRETTDPKPVEESKTEQNEEINILEEEK